MGGGGDDGKWDIPEVVGKKEKLEGNVTLTPCIYDDPILFALPM